MEWRLFERYRYFLFQISKLFWRLILFLGKSFFLDVDSAVLRELSTGSSFSHDLKSKTTDNDRCRLLLKCINKILITLTENISKTIIMYFWIVGAEACHATRRRRKRRKQNAKRKQWVRRWPETAPPLMSFADWNISINNQHLTVVHMLARITNDIHCKLIYNSDR